MRTITLEPARPRHPILWTLTHLALLTLGLSIGRVMVRPEAVAPPPPRAKLLLRSFSLRKDGPEVTVGAVLRHEPGFWLSRIDATITGPKDPPLQGNLIPGKGTPYFLQHTPEDIETGDYNGDGFTDFRLRDATAPSGEPHHAYWLWDPGANRYRFDETLFVTGAPTESLTIACNP